MVGELDFLDYPRKLLHIWVHFVSKVNNLMGFSLIFDAKSDTISEANNYNEE